MRIKTTCRPISPEYTSMVDLVRRGDPPPYARVARWVNWTEPGGIVWAFVWLRIALMLVFFGICAGLAYAPIKGIPYRLPPHKLSHAEVERILDGQSILDPDGTPVIDPTTRSVSVYHVQDGNGPQLKYESGTPKAGESAILVLMIDETAGYQDFVTALDDLRWDRGDVEVFLAPVGRGTKE